MHAERAGWAMVIGLGLALAGCQTERPPAPVIAPPPSCHDIDFSIYFEPGSAGITREAAQLISSARDRAQGCRVTGIVVVGLADAKGTRGANLELSKARADSVSRFLAASGFSSVEFREGAAGAAGAATPAGAQKPLRRRADVAIHLAPPS